MRTRLVIFLGLLLVAPFAVHAAPDQAARWQAARINPARSIELDKAVALYARLRPRYEVVTAMRPGRGVPALVVFCLHYREASNSFACSLAQGDPLTHRSRNVPRGRLPDKAPPYGWEEVAADAVYNVDRLDLKDWSTAPSALAAIEGYNGTGYARFHPSVPTPYLWSGTTLYSRGKYTGDGRFDPLAVDRQLGCAAIFLRCRERGIPLPFPYPAGHPPE